MHIPHYFFMGKPVSSFVYVIVYYVGASITTLLSISDGFDLYFFCRKVEKTRSMKEEMGGEVFISRQSWHFSSLGNMIKVLLPIYTLNWRLSTYVSRQGKGIKRTNENTINIKAFLIFWFCFNFL